MPIIKEEIHDTTYEGTTTNNPVNENVFSSRKFSCSSNESFASSTTSSNDFTFEQQFINDIINQKDERRQASSPVFSSAASEVQLRFVCLFLPR